MRGARRSSWQLALRLACAFCVMAWASRAQAQNAEPPREPILRIETGMHTAGITRIGVDAGRYLVTGSADKTVRVWEEPP